MLAFAFTPGFYTPSSQLVGKGYWVREKTKTENYLTQMQYHKQAHTKSTSVSGWIREANNISDTMTGDYESELSLNP